MNLAAALGASLEGPLTPPHRQTCLLIRFTRPISAQLGVPPSKIADSLLDQNLRRAPKGHLLIGTALRLRSRARTHLPACSLITGNKQGPKFFLSRFERGLSK